MFEHKARACRTAAARFAVKAVDFIEPKQSTEKLFRFLIALLKVGKDGTGVPPVFIDFAKQDRKDLCDKVSRF